MTHMLGKKIDPVVLDQYCWVINAAKAKYYRMIHDAWDEYYKACDVTWAEHSKACNALYRSVQAEYDIAHNAALDVLLITASDDPVASWIISTQLSSNPDEAMQVLRMLPASLIHLDTHAKIHGWCNWNLRVAMARLAGILDGESPA